MPASTFQVLRIPKSGYKKCKTTSSCETATGADYYASIGRSWTGNQRRPRQRFNIPTPCGSETYEANLGTVNQGVCSCATKPAFSIDGPLGPGSGEFGERTLDGKNVRSVQSRALANFSNNAGLGVTAAELTSTGRMLTDRLTAVTRILSSLRRGDIKGAASVLYQHTGYNTSHVEARLRARPNRTYADRASSFWLETAFGWAPLLQSVYDAMKVLDLDRTTRRRARSSSKHVRSGVTAEFRTTSGNRFSALGLTNPAEIAWDLVPFSFVIDWFIPIGVSIRFLGTKFLVQAVYQWTAREYGRAYYSSNYLGAPDGTFMKSYLRYTRSIALPTVSTFHFRLPSSWWHAVTSASLIQSLRPR